MKLSREKIQRMVGAEIGGSAGGGGGESIGGFATQAWVNNNYVSIEWFDQIFQVFDDVTKLDVNGELPTDTSKLNIKAMFGFWTDFYISALGNGGQVGASIYLSTLADVNVAGVQLGQVLTWKLDPSDSRYKWMAGDVQSGVDMTTVWNALAASTSQQINASHLTTALTGYATTTWVNNQGFATTAWVGQQGFATTSWVSSNFLGLHATADAATKLATARTLWGQSFDGTANVSGDMSDVGYMVFSHNETTFKYGGGSYTDPAPGDDYNFKFGGSLAATYLRARYGVLSDGYVTALSDEREKNIIEHFQLSLERIAKAPIISYTWKDTQKRGDAQHIGSIAQYWLAECPELVPEVNGRYTMDYGRIALISAITIARTTVNHEQRLRELERRILNS